MSDELKGTLQILNAKRDDLQRKIDDLNTIISMVEGIDDPTTSTPEVSHPRRQMKKVPGTHFYRVAPAVRHFLSTHKRAYSLDDILEAISHMGINGSVTKRRKRLHTAVSAGVVKGEYIRTEYGTYQYAHNKEVSSASAEIQES